MMLDFACTDVKTDEIIRCGLGISKTELNILRAVNNDMLNTSEIAENVGCSLSLAQRSSKELYEKELLERRQINLNGGGYEYRYRRIPEADLKNRVVTQVKKWCEVATKHIQERTI